MLVVGSPVDSQMIAIRGVSELDAIAVETLLLAKRFKGSSSVAINKKWASFCCFYWYGWNQA